MEVKEVVTISGGTKRSSLYTVFIEAARGNYKDVAAGTNQADIDDLESMLEREFNDFATKAFNMGREYEKNTLKLKT